MRSSAIIIALVASLAFGQSAAPKVSSAKAAATKRSKAKASAKKAAAKVPAPTYKVEAVNDANDHPDLAPMAAGSAALRAQILLDRANFSIGEINGKIGSNTETALNGF